MEPEVDGTRKLKGDAECPKCHSPAHHVRHMEFTNEMIRCLYFPCRCEAWVNSYDAFDEEA